MSKFDLKTMGLLSAGMILAVAPLLSARAANLCDVPQVGPDARACAAAAQGPTELRRFVERTRTIYGLYYWDYARPDQASAAAAPASVPSRMASSSAEREQRAP